MRKLSYITIFEAKTNNLKPIFENFFFAIFDKPSGILVHPSSTKDYSYTLLDEIRYLYGNNASLVHRIDKETSGLVLVSKNKFSEAVLKQMFENKEYKKIYKAVVKGKIEKKIDIHKPISNSDSQIKIKMATDEKGKESRTIITPIKYNKEKNQTLIEAIPLTGRQHQIRVHLDSIGHNIIGDPIYGIDENIANDILNKKISKEERTLYTKSSRLLLQAQYLEFEFLDTIYRFSSNLDFFE
ncbi:RNA pseudouridine synthase [Malaciobacter pacificus]|uniref:RluA family pseudouridine synthase n=1 Tax=Malaciobacter pacificus TaxID=1080223 RepID=UPI00102A0279|nr:RNA pseudouridine synthase [Malaciobacter pacificus]GGD49956.1 RNA pseudouridine synthase [Malaciobacter pacificus]